MAENNGKTAYDYSRSASEQQANTQSSKQAYNKQQANVTQENLNDLAASVKELGVVIAQEVGKGIDQAAKEVSKGLEEATKNFNQTSNQAANAHAQKAAASYYKHAPAYGSNGMSAIRKSTRNFRNKMSDSANYFWGTILAVVGAFFLVTGGKPDEMNMYNPIIRIIVGFAGTYISEIIAGILILALSAVLITMSVRFFMRPARRKRMERYLKAMGDEDAVPLTRFAEVVCHPVKKVKKDLTLMIRNGELPDGFIDEESEIFFVSAEKYRALQRKQEASSRMQAGMHNSIHPERDELMQQIVDFLYLLDGHIESTAEQPAVCDRLKKMKRTSTDIQIWTQAHPDKISRVRRFASYYMPTTLKMLRTYDDVKEQPGDTAESIRNDINDILDKLNVGFDNLRTSLLTDTALDVSGEISAMQTMMAQDGMAEPIFEVKE